MATGRIKFVIKGKRAEDERHYVSGWAYVSKADGDVVVDHSGQSIDIHELERAMQQFAKDGAVSGEMHEGAAPNPVVESFTFTPEKIEALGLPADFPQGTVITIEVDEPTFQKVKNGSYMMFSIEGKALETAA